MMEMKMPEKIELGYKTFQVLAAKPGDLAIKIGAMNHDRCTITVNLDYSPLEQANTLIHECLHGVYKLAGLNKGGDDEEDREERVVEIMANGIIELLRRNPEMAKWLLRSIK